MYVARVPHYACPTNQSYIQSRPIDCSIGILAADLIMPEIRELDAPSLSQDEEFTFINDNLNYMENIFRKLSVRQPKLPEDSQRRLQTFKHAWRDFFAEGEQEAAASNEVVSEPLERPVGAIPKKKLPTERKTVSTNDSLSHEDYDSNTDSSSSDSRETTFKPLTVPVNKHLDKGDAGPANLVKALEKIDLRNSPPLAPFDEQSGQKLSRYLHRFEQYCVINFKCSSELWLDQLERQLSGRTLKAFKSLWSPDDTFEDLKEKLLEWYNDMSELRKEKSKSDFKRARYEEEESMFLFSNRLARLFKNAYPRRRINASKVLREKYVSTVPKKFRKQLESQTMSAAVKGKVITWQTIQTCARHFDLECEKKYGNSCNSDDALVNISSTRKLKDSSTQCDPVPESRDHNFSSQPAWNGILRTPPGTNQTRSWYSNLPAIRPATGNEECTHCGRLGHFAANCRSRNNLCFACGSSGHYLRECHLQQRGPVRSNFRPSRSRSQQAVRNSNYSQPDRRTSVSLDQHGESLNYPTAPATNNNSSNYPANTNSNHLNDQTPAQWR